MSPRRYLVGPVSAEVADQYFLKERRSGRCLAFDHVRGTDLVIGPTDDWTAVRERLPAGWEPDFIVLELAYRHIPACLWSALIPVIGLADDWNLLWHYYRRRLSLCDLVMTDFTGVEKLRAAGIEHVRQVNLFGCERVYVEQQWPETERDIDVLFVGNMHPAVQRERLSWLGRLARLGTRRNVVIRGGVFGEEYRSLLARAKIAFNRSIRGECNKRVFEAAAAGALLFQEAGNREVPDYFRDGQECIYYSDDNLEALLEHYLEHDAERRQIAEAARSRIEQFTFEKLWEQEVHWIDANWPALIERSAKRCETQPADDLLIRTWQMLGCSSGEDRTLFRDLRYELEKNPRASALHNAMGLVVTWLNQQGGRITPALAQTAAEHFERAWQCDPQDVMAGLNLLEALVTLGQKDRAIDVAHQLLALLDWGAERQQPIADGGHFAPSFDYFRVEWERAAWEHPGEPHRETEAKRSLIRWRLRMILGDLTDDVVHYCEAQAARPDLPVTQLALGCSLARANRSGEAAAHLRQALAANPFDSNAAFSLFNTLEDLGDGIGQQRLVRERRLLAKAADRLVPREDWFAERVPAVRPSGGQPLGIIWEGAQIETHSYALINREVCRRLIERGHEVGHIATDLAPGSDVKDPRLAPHVGRIPDKPKAAHIVNRWPPNLTPPAEGHWIVMQPWEFGSLPRAWVDAMTAHADEVWVPSWYVRDCFAKSGVPLDRVQVIPLGVGTAFSPAAPPISLPTTKGFKFLFVGGTIFRKGIDVLLEAFTRAFGVRDDVCLVIKDACVQSFYLGQTSEQQVARYQAIPNSPEIIYLNRELSEEEMAGLYTTCNCLVHPYRGEGFGLPIAEALACGLPVIVTGHGAALDFCNDDNAYFVPARLARFKEKRVGEYETVDQPWLAEPDGNALCVLLRHVVAHPEEARAKGHLGAEHIKKNFTWDQTVDAVEARLEALRDRPIRRQFVRAAPSGQVQRPRVSLAMIVKNEEGNLPACLDSAAGVFDEIVIVDTGSTDRTKEIADGYGARVFDFPWIDNFAAARNESIRHATGDWIFWLDADDRLDETNRDKLKELFESLKDENVAYVMKCLCLPDQTGTTTVVDHVRLFRNDSQMRWKYRVHEQILPALRALGGDVRWSDVVIQHVGYQDPGLRKRKLERDLRLLQIENDEQPDDPFALFNLGSVFQELGQVEKAVPVLRRSLELSNPGDSIVRKLYALLSQCHKHLGQKPLALAACRKGREFYPDDIELLFQEGQLRHESGDASGAESAWLRLLETREGAHFASIDAGLVGYKTRHNLAVLYFQQGRLREAETQWRQCLSEHLGFAPALVGLAELFLSQGRLEELEQVAVDLDSTARQPIEAAVLRARAHLGRNEFQQARQLLEEAISQSSSAVLPRRFLSYALLKEGKDPEAAESALRGLLTLAPNDEEAKHNLRLLLQEQGRI